MSSIKDQLTAEMKAAMKSGNKSRLGTIRMLLAAVKQAEVDSRTALSDEQVLDVLTKAAKQRRESIDQYEQANRLDLADIERAELAVITTFLPEQLSDDEISNEIDRIIKETNAAGMKDMGKVMGVANQTLKGRADMALVSKKVKEQLSA
ncbi:MAG TPA: GatB/YqeY domain-containing protein [Halothiobacillaceae bacterium]|nr:GatB/YqeY domain-containing protein [Halothiobacillaceae bacterium]